MHWNKNPLRLTPENAGSYLRVFTAFHNRGQQIQLAVISLQCRRFDFEVTHVYIPYIISLIKSTVLHIKSKFSPVTMWRHTGSDGSVTDKHMKTIEMAPPSCLVILVSSWIIWMQNHSKNGNVKKRNRFYEQNHNSARASCFFVHFFAVPPELRSEISRFWVDLRTEAARR